MVVASDQTLNGSYRWDPQFIGPAITALLVTFALLLLLKAVWPARLWCRRQRRFPPVAGSVFHQLLRFTTLHDFHAELSAKYRKTFSLWAPGFSRQMYIVDPVNVEYILKTNFNNYGKGWYNLEKMKDLLGEGIFAVDGDKWRHQRKLASFEFATRVLRNFSSTAFKSDSGKLATIIGRMSSSLQPFDIQDLFLKSTMDSIFKVGFGVDLHCLDGTNERGAKFARAFDDCSVVISMRYIDVFWKLKRFLNIGMEAQLRKNIRIIDEFVYQIIQDRMDHQSSRSGSDSKRLEEELGSETKNCDILSRFLLESVKDPKRMTTRYLRDIILNFVIAGKDTTAGTLAWFFYMMCKHPNVQEEVALEVMRETAASSTADSSGVDSDSADQYNDFASLLTEEALQKMHMLHAALSETLRLYPAVPLDPKVCFSDDILPDGHEVRKGDTVYYQPYAMGRMKFLWGDDAEAFRPQRWLDEDGQFRGENPFKFTAFQAGPRICLGKEFAYWEMKIVAAMLLRFFAFKLKDETKPAHYRTMLTLHVDGGVHVYAMCRRAPEALIKSN